jgi:hypothetical protein
MTTVLRTEAFVNGLGEIRYRFVIHSPKVGHLSGHPGYTKSLRAWRSRSGAYKAGRKCLEANAAELLGERRPWPSTRSKYEGERDRARAFIVPGGCRVF